MTRYEFLERLRAVLHGEMPDQAVEEQIRFYERYISSETASGKSEEDVLAGLGDARLIARTILETWQSDDTDLEYHAGSGDGQRSYQSYDAQTDSDGNQSGYRRTQIYEETYEDNDRHRSQQKGGSFFGMNGKIYRLDKWYLKLIPIAIVLLILGFVFTMIFGMMKLSIMVLTSPIFWGFLAVVTILRIFSRRR